MSFLYFSFANHWSRVYEYMMKAGGLSLEEDYGHYLGVDGKCHANDVQRERKVQISGFVNVTQYNAEHLKQVSSSLMYWSILQLIIDVPTN